MAQKLKRSINMGFRVDKEEHDFLEMRMKQAGWSNFRNFIIHLAARGYIVKFETDKILELSQLLRNLSNNVNQIAKKANETGRIYEQDIADIKNGQNELWERLDKLLKAVAELQEIEVKL